MAKQPIPSPASANELLEQFLQTNNMELIVQPPVFTIGQGGALCAVSEPQVMAVFKDDTTKEAHATH